MYVAYSKENLILRGSLLDVCKAAYAQGNETEIVIFEESSYQVIEIDCFSGTIENLIERVDKFSVPIVKSARPRGRPKMGVISREVTLLPRHWEWLETQAGGISATLRRLVASARKDPDQQKQYRKTLLLEKAHRFCAIVAGDVEGFEEASRALYHEDLNGFKKAIQSWPYDIAETAKRLAKEAVGSN